MEKQPLLELIARTNWTALGAPAHYITCFPWMVGFMRMRNYFKEYYKLDIFTVVDGLGGQWTEEEQNLKNTKQLYENPKETKKIINNWMKDNKEFLSFIKKTTLNLNKISDKEILERYQLYLNKFCDIWAPSLSVDAMGAYTENELLNEFEKAIDSKEKANAHEYFAKLSHPAYVSFMSKEHISLLNLALLYKEGINIEKAIEEHQESFFWIQGNYKEIRVLSKEYFFSKIKEESNKSVEEIKNEINKLLDIKTIEKTRQDLLKKLKLPKQLEEKILLTQILGIWQDNRKEMNLLGNYYLNEILKEVAKRKKYDLEDFYYVYPSEMPSLLLENKKIEVKTLKERRKALIFVIEQPEKETYYVGKDAQDILEALEKARKLDEVKEIKGVVASKGKSNLVKGIARIVLDPSKNEFQNGEILVASMTRPEYVPLMKKALAVVTDEGGITSHAAIVSRELGIPCIIGAKVATKILKDGSLIELNTEKGTIKIL